MWSRQGSEQASSAAAGAQGGVWLICGAGETGGGGFRVQQFPICHQHRWGRHRCTAKLRLTWGWVAGVGASRRSYQSVLSLASAAAALPFVILTLVNTPYKRGFYCGDDSIRYPYQPDTITNGLMAGVTITVTVILVRPP